MRKKRKIGLWFLILIASIIAILYFAWSFAPGSYSRAEIYELEVSEETLLKIIESVKKENPSIVLKEKVGTSKTNKFYLKEGRRNEKDFWYSIYFYYPDKNQIVKTWTRPKTKTITNFAFVGINQGLILGNWKDANESFLWWKNKTLKHEFENRILNKIKEKINKEIPTKNIEHLSDSTKFEDYSN